MYLDSCKQSCFSGQLSTRALGSTLDFAKLEEGKAIKSLAKCVKSRSRFCEC